MKVGYYNCTFIDEAMGQEINDLLAGEHGKTLMAWSMECANAGVAGYRHGLQKGNLIVAGGAAIVIGAVYLGKKFINKHNQKKNKKTDEVIEEA